LIDRHGRAILAFSSHRVSACPGPRGIPRAPRGLLRLGRRNSTYGNLLVVSTNAQSGTHGPVGLENNVPKGLHSGRRDRSGPSPARGRRSGNRCRRSYRMLWYFPSRSVRRFDASRRSTCRRRALGLWRSGLSFSGSARRSGNHTSMAGARSMKRAALVARTTGSQAPHSDLPVAVFTFRDDERRA